MENKALDCYHKLLEEGYPERAAQRLRLVEGEYDAMEYVRNHLFNFQVNPPVVEGLLQNTSSACLAKKRQVPSYQEHTLQNLEERIRQEPRKSLQKVMPTYF